jgi:hypothetical protein
MAAVLTIAASGVVADRKCQNETDFHSKAEGDVFCDLSTCDGASCKDPFLTVVGSGEGGTPVGCKNCKPVTGATCTLKTPSTVADLYFRSGTCEFTNPQIPGGRGELSSIDCHCDSDGGPVTGPTTIACKC